MTRNLDAAKAAKNDEFYTQLADIENEVNKYKIYFKNKIVLMPCDDPMLIKGLGNSIEESSSKFWVFFHKNFKRFGLKKIIATHFAPEFPAYIIEYEGGNDNDVSVYVRRDLKENGDFRSDEIKPLFKECDIVVTNPPFSLFREFIAQIIEMKKHFLIIGNKNAITYKETFKLIKQNKLWLGYTNVKEFKKLDGKTQKFGNIGWYTNLPTTRRNEALELYANYDPNVYLKYDNYDAINVDKVTEIPMDYFGDIGVPITFLDKYNPEQFEIVGLGDGKQLFEFAIEGLSKEFVTNYFEHGGTGALNVNHPTLGYYKNGKAIRPYARVVIRRKDSK